MHSNEYRYRYNSRFVLAFAHKFYLDPTRSSSPTFSFKSTYSNASTYTWISLLSTMRVLFIISRLLASRIFILYRGPIESVFVTYFNEPRSRRSVLFTHTFPILISESPHCRSALGRDYTAIFSIFRQSFQFRSRSSAY